MEIDHSHESGHHHMPLPITSSYGAGHGHMIREVLPQHNHMATGTATVPPISSSIEEDNNHQIVAYKKMVRYRECLKNHAASMGGTAIDGCGEFMPSGEDGTLEALKCSACHCHRNFHRKEVEGEAAAPINSFNIDHLFRGRKVVGQKGVLIAGSDHVYGNYQATPRPHPQMIMPFNLGSYGSEQSDEQDGGMGVRPAVLKKRFRTKFTPEQKEKMLGFAEKLGWRMQKQEEGAVQQFCQEIGIRRRVLRVWMHNNKHNFAKKATSPPLILN